MENADARKRILYVHGVSQIGGAERELLSWLKCLDPARFHLYVVCSKEGPLTTELKKMKISYVAFHLPAWRKLFQMLLRPLAIVRLVNIIRRWHIDVLHVNDYWWAPIGIIAGRLTGRPCLVHVRQEIETRKVAQYWLTQASLVIPVSQSIRNVIRRAGVPQEKIHVLLSGVVPHSGTPSFASSESLDVHKYVKGQPIIGTVANLFPRKGLEYLVQATKHLSKDFPHIVLVIVGTGDPDYEQQLKTEVESLKLTEHVQFVGFQDQPEIFVSQFDVFVLPSVVEGFGIVLLEAMALGKPIVASKVGGIPEIVQHGKTGLLVHPANVEDLSQALLRLLNDPEERIRMGNEARKRIEEHFSLRKMLHCLYEFYSKVLEENTRSAKCQ